MGWWGCTRDTRTYYRNLRCHWHYSPLDCAGATECAILPVMLTVIIVLAIGALVCAILDKPSYGVALLAVALLIKVLPIGK